MTREETIKWLESLKSEIGKSEHRTLWHYAEAIDMAIEALSAEASQNLAEPNKELKGSDLIRREDAIDAWDKLSKRGRTEFDQVLMTLPSTEPKTGKWVMLERVENVHDIYGVPTWGVNYMCDNCGFIHTAIQDHFSQYKHCPNCGARMKGADDEREDIQSTDE